MSASTMEELIARLDPDREYGERTYEQVVEQVRAGRLKLRSAKHDPDGIPVIVDAKTGLVVRGTAKMARDGLNGAAQSLGQALADYLESGGQEKVTAVIDETLNMDSKHDIPWKSRVDMVAYLTDRTMGRIHERRTNDYPAELERLLRLAQLGKLNEQRSISEAPQLAAREVEVDVE